MRTAFSSFSCLSTRTVNLFSWACMYIWCECGVRRTLKRGTLAAATHPPADQRRPENGSGVTVVGLTRIAGEREMDIGCATCRATGASTVQRRAIGRGGTHVIVKQQ